MDAINHRIDDNFPNITLTALSMKFLKARYYNNIDSIRLAKDLPFVGYEKIIDASL